MDEPAADSWWCSCDPASIPSKENLHRSFVALLQPEGYFVERFNTGALNDGAAGGGSQQQAGQQQQLRVLDAGCGDGRIALGLARSGCNVVGMDVNPAAVAAANAAAAAVVLSPPGASESGTGGLGTAEFVDGSCGEASTLAEALGDRSAGGFDMVLAQLLVSVVGGAAERAALLLALRGVLRPGGKLLLSASAVSDDINPDYAEVYRRGLEETGEEHSYISRDESGGALYRTHHFTFGELSALVKESGFELVAMNKEREASSRRPDQAAWFIYVVAEHAPS